MSIGSGEVFAFDFVVEALDAETRCIELVSEGEGVGAQERRSLPLFAEFGVPGFLGVFGLSVLEFGVGGMNSSASSDDDDDAAAASDSLALAMRFESCFAGAMIRGSTTGRPRMLSFLPAFAARRLARSAEVTDFLVSRATSLGVFVFVFDSFALFAGGFFAFDAFPVLFWLALLFFGAANGFPVRTSSS